MSLYCMKIRPLHAVGVLLVAATVVWYSAFAQVRINEVMADNGGGNPDYIELITERNSSSVHLKKLNTWQTFRGES